MKRTIILITAAALALVGCNKVQDVYTGAPQEIAFNAVNQPMTKGQYAIMNEGFPADNTMEVRAYQSSATAGEYFAKTTFSKGTTYWAGNQFWPLSAATINFFAVSGYGLTASHITIADALASATVVYTTGNSYAATTQSDIMYAFNRGAVTQSDNALTFPAKVDMVFKHALALIDFEVKGDSATETGAITVNSITLNGATYNGTLTLTNTNAATLGDAVTTAVSWDAGSSVDAQAVPGISANTAITADYVRIGNGLMVIPGTGITSFTINYSINGHSYDYTYNPSLATTVAANKYTYRINFKLHEILINPSVTPWTNTNTDITIQE